jgi:hypothetical protein
MGTPRHAAVLVTALLSSLALAPANAAGPPAVAAPYRPGHVFVIVIENKSFDQAYVSNPNPYLKTTLPAQGQLLTQFYGTAHRSLPNYIAQLSGQGPNADTQRNCSRYVDFVPAAKNPVGPLGQVAGKGCVYPTSVKTLPDQLEARGIPWRAYMGDLGNDRSRAPARCGAPGSPAGKGVRDTAKVATAKDAYATRHNPFVYFHSILDDKSCEANVLPLTDLAADLANPAPFTWITPNLCDDGHDTTCPGRNVAGGREGGLHAVDLFLARYVPMIQASEAYKRDGLLIITSDESEAGDAKACCGQVRGPNVAKPGIKGPGGGLIGTVLLGRCVEPGSTNATPYNHYSLLRSLEDIYGFKTGGSDGKGHLGYAGQAGLASFGADVFGGCPTAPTQPAPEPTPTPTPSPSPSPAPGGGLLPIPSLPPLLPGVTSTAATPDEPDASPAWLVGGLGAAAVLGAFYFGFRRGPKKAPTGRHRA